MRNLIIGCLYTLIAQILTFFQLQGNIKYNLYNRYPITLLLLSIPISWLYIQSVKYFVIYFGGDVWPSRILGTIIGIIVFTLMAIIIFKEPVTLKTFICILLSILILAVQLLMK
jgi:hypothetical protein